MGKGKHKKRRRWRPPDHLHFQSQRGGLPARSDAGVKAHKPHFSREAGRGVQAAVPGIEAEAGSGQPPENLHQLYPEAAAELENNPQLFPGLNSCAVCAVRYGRELMTECSHCHKVLYCGKKHQRRDRHIHGQYVTLLPKKK